MSTADMATDFPPAWQDRWRDAFARIAQAGYGDTVSREYARAGPMLARLVGPEIAVRLAAAISYVAIRSGAHAAALLPAAAVTVAKRTEDHALLAAWLQAVEEVAKKAPESINPLLGATDRLISTLSGLDFVGFIRMGLEIGRDDPARRSAFFSLESADARQLIERDLQPGGVSALRHGLSLYLTALWGIAPSIAEAPLDMPEQIRRRPGFGGGGIRLPSSFAGFAQAEAKLLYQAALAHIGAHHRFTPEKFSAKGLKPLQIALVSLVEDARVERLAIGEMPGLHGLWRRFHVARPQDSPLAISLMARLSRALIEPGYLDGHGWVEKGRALFEQAAAIDIYDQQLSRRIGGLLGNDIGQMRLQFDARTYVVQPAYRDENLAIWDFDADETSRPIELEALAEGVRIERQERDNGRKERGEGTEKAAGRLSQDGKGVIVARYPEFDYITRRYRPDWCAIREKPARSGSASDAAALRDTRSDIVDSLSALIRSSRVNRQQRIRRQSEGEVLDVDAAISAMISRRAGVNPDARVYSRYQRLARDMSVLVLIDASQSTNDKVRDSKMSVLEIERIGTTLLARAMAKLGDPFAIAAFCSNTREDIRYFRIKNFDQPFDETALGRLAGLRGELSTRLGAAIRHAGRDIAQQSAYRKLLLILTDGEPSDVDADDRRHLVEDARAAVGELSRQGVDVFCVALDSSAGSYASRIFGPRGSVHINSLAQLPDMLPALYLRLRR